MSLAAIEALVSRSEWDEALELAVIEWRTWRSPAHADLIEALSARTSRPPLPTGDFHYSFDASWLSRARTSYAADLGPLLDTFAVSLVSQMERAWFDEKVEAARVRAALAREGVSLDPSAVGPFISVAFRVHALAARGPDPRTARALVRFLKLAPVSAEGALAIATYGPVFALLEEIGDVRILPDLEALPPSGMRDRAIQVHRDLVLAPPPDAARVLELARDLGFSSARAVADAPPPDVAALFELVVEAPDDDGPREVLADRWSEAGDPRGELVMLQLRAARGQASAAELERAKSLEGSVAADWLGELALGTRDRRFRRGFLEEFALMPEDTLLSARWDAVAKAPVLGTVRVLRRGVTSDAVYKRFLFSPAMRNLVDAEIGTERMLKMLMAAPARRKQLRRIELTTPPLDLNAIRSFVERLVEAGMERVVVPFSSARSIDAHVSLLRLASEMTTVTLRAIDALFTSQRTASGLVLDITSRDAQSVSKALDACPDASLVLRRPHGAKLYGPDGHTRRLANQLRARGKATPDASWTAMLKS